MSSRTHNQAGYKYTTLQIKKEHVCLLNAFENRNGKILIEVTQGTVLNEYAVTDLFDYYIHYDINRFSKGDKIQRFLYMTLIITILMVFCIGLIL